MKYQVSLIIPIYNVENYITESLLSALNQTFESIEYILVDDCSTDGSIKIAKEIIDQHPRKQDIYIYSHDQNRGLSASRNTGLSNATAGYVFFMDSDDEITIDCIANHYKVMICENISFTVANMELVGAKSIHINKISGTLTKMKPLSSFFQKKWNVSACNKLYSRKFLSENNLVFSYGIMYEDVLWSYKLSLNAINIGFVKENTYTYKVRSGSITTMKNSGKKIESILYIIKAMIKDYDKGLISGEHFKDLCRYIDFWRLISALLLLNSSENTNSRKIYFKSIKDISKLKSANIYSLLLRLPFFLFLARIPYILYKKIVS